MVGKEGLWQVERSRCMLRSVVNEVHRKQKSCNCK